MNSFQVISLAIGIIGLAVLFIMIIQYQFGRKDYKKNNPIAINFTSHLFNKHFIGTEVKSLGRKNGREIIRLAPKDIDAEQEKVDFEEIIIDPEHCISLPKGTLSPDRDINLYFPIKAEDYHPSFRKSGLGQALMFATELKNSWEAKEKAIRKGSDIKTEFLSLMGDGEISKEMLSKIVELIGDYKKISESSKKEQKDTSLPGFSK